MVSQAVNDPSCQDMQHCCRGNKAQRAAACNCSAGSDMNRCRYRRTLPMHVKARNQSDIADDTEGNTDEATDDVTGNETADVTNNATDHVSDENTDEEHI